MAALEKKRYGSFALAAAAYVAGVLIFSVWSYTAHRNELLSFVDQSLMDAAFSAREIINPAMIQCLEEEPFPIAASTADLQSRLVRMSRHGRFTSIGVAVVHNEHVDLQLSCSAPENAELSLQLHALKKQLQHELLQLSLLGRNDAALLTFNSPPHGHMRIAVVYTAREAGAGAAFLAVQHSSVIEEELGDQMLRLSAAGIGMLVLAVPLIILFSRSQKETAIHLSEMNDHLQQDMDLQKSREEELKDAISDLERFNSVTAGRESRIIELKAEINELLDEMNRSKRYNIDKID